MAAQRQCVSVPIALDLADAGDMRSALIARVKTVKKNAKVSLCFEGDDPDATVPALQLLAAAKASLAERGAKVEVTGVAAKYFDRK